MGEWSKEVFSKNLQYYIENSRITQKDLAKIIGVSAPTMNDWVKGHKFPRIDKIEKLAAYFGILKSDLIEDKQKQPVQDELSDVKRALIDLIDGLSENEAAVLLASLKSGLGR